MLVVSFNTNSLRLRLHQLEALIARHAPDVIAIQETKVNDPDFPVDAITAMGYAVEYFGQKTHYGVALMIKGDYTNVRKGYDSDTEQDQKRIITADCVTPSGNTVSIINGYFPQGENRNHAVKFPAKRKFYEDLNTLLSQHYDPNNHVLVVGDFNIAPVDNDIGIGPDNAKRWLKTGVTCFLPEEREWLNTTMAWGLQDTFRVKYPEVNDLFSWFDYRSKGFDREPKRGLRIDHLLATESLTAKLIDSGIDYDIRAMEKPSDHCPVWSSFDV